MSSRLLTSVPSTVSLQKSHVNFTSVNLEKKPMRNLENTTYTNNSTTLSRSKKKKYFLTVVSRLPTAKSTTGLYSTSLIQTKWFFTIFNSQYIYHDQAFGLVPLPFPPFPFPFFFFSFLFFIISACNYLIGWETVSGNSKRNTILLSLTSVKSFRATPSGIQLFLKLYLAMDWLFLIIETIYFSIFSSIESPMSSW